MDPGNRSNTPCKPMFAINPKIIRPSGAEIATHALSRNAMSRNARVAISAPEGRIILGLMANIGLHGVLLRFLQLRRLYSNSSFKGSIFGTLLSKSRFFKRSPDLFWPRFGLVGGL